MPIPSDTGAAVRARIPAVMVRGADSPVSIDLGLNGGAVTYTASSCTLYSPTGTELEASGDLGSGSGSIAHTIPAASIPSTLSFGENYRIVWTATVGGDVLTFAMPAILARYPMHCPITQADLEAEYPDLNAAHRSSTSSSLELQAFIDSAWEDVVRWIVREGHYAEQVYDTHVFVEPTRHLALHKVFRAYSMGGSYDNAYGRLADEHATAYRRALSEVRFRADADQDGIPDSNDSMSASMVARRGSAYYRYRRSTSRVW